MCAALVLMTLLKNKKSRDKIFCSKNKRIIWRMPSFNGNIRHFLIAGGYDEIFGKSKTRHAHWHSHHDHYIFGTSAALVYRIRARCCYR